MVKLSGNPYTTRDGVYIGVSWCQFACIIHAGVGDKWGQEFGRGVFLSVSFRKRLHTD